MNGLVPRLLEDLMEKRDLYKRGMEEAKREMISRGLFTRPTAVCGKY